MSSVTVFLSFVSYLVSLKKKGIKKTVIQISDEYFTALSATVIKDQRSV